MNFKRFKQYLKEEETGQVPVNNTTQVDLTPFVFNTILRRRDKKNVKQPKKYVKQPKLSKKTNDRT